MNKTLLICRGVSGAGKSTFARYIFNLHDDSIYNQCTIREADSFFIKGDKYEFNPNLLGQAHKKCQEDVENDMAKGVRTIILSNTSTSERELKPYLELANKYNYNIISLVIENRHNSKNIHNVPLETLVKQELRLRSSLKLK